MNVLPMLQNKVGSAYNEVIREFGVLESMTGIPKEYHIALALHESGINPRIENSIGAVGLFQWLPSTYMGLGYTREQMLNMSVAEQVRVQQKFIRPLVGKVRTWHDVYLYNFFPVAVLQKWDDSHVIEYGTLTAAKVANSNAPLDLNNDKQITVAEYKQYIEQYLKKRGFDMSNIITEMEYIPTDYSKANEKKKILKNVLFGFLGMVLIFVVGRMIVRKIRRKRNK